MENFFKGKTILITGGTGSIGSKVVEYLLNFDIKSIRILSRDEYKQHKFSLSNPDKRLRFLLGDIRDFERIKYALRDVDIVIHCAALKHVPLCENNPFEAVKTNVIGTQNLLLASILNNVKYFTLVSTDKAVEPTSVMGATKLLAERITLAANNYKGNTDIKFNVVRFGNVLASRGSVLEIWKKQAKEGYIQITDPNMDRYFMDLSQAVKLILKATSSNLSNKIFILKMKKVKLETLADVFIEIWNKKYKTTPKKIIIGKRLAEKISEKLWNEYESNFLKVDKDYLIIDFSKQQNNTSVKEEFYSKEELYNLIFKYL